MSTLAILTTVVAIACFGPIVLVDAWIDGRRQRVLNRGPHTVTSPDGHLTSEEVQHGL